MLQGEKEAEKMIVEAYAALLLAFLSTERFPFYPLNSFPSKIFLDNDTMSANPPWCPTLRPTCDTSMDD